MSTEEERLDILIRAKTDQYLRELNKAERATRGFADRSEGKLKRLSDKGFHAAGLAAGALSVAVVGIGVSAVKTAAQYEQALTNAISVTGLLGNAATEARQQADDLALTLGAKTVFSAQQAADAMYDLASKGYEVSSWAKALPGILDLAAATQSDLAATTEMVTSTINQFNMAQSETGRVADVYAKAISSSAATQDKLAMSMRYAGPVAQSLGWTLEETTAVLAKLYDAGFRGEQAGTALRGAIAALINPSKDAQQVMERFGLTIESLQSEGIDGLIESMMEGQATTTDFARLFGTEAAPAMLALRGYVGDAASTVDDLTAALENSGGTAARIAENQLDTLSGQFTILRGSLETFLISLGNLALPVLKAGVSGLVGPVNALSSALGSIGDFASRIPRELWMLFGIGGGAFLAGRNMRLLAAGASAAGSAFLSIRSGLTGMVALFQAGSWARAATGITSTAGAAKLLGTNLTGAIGGFTGLGAAALPLIGTLAGIAALLYLNRKRAEALAAEHVSASDAAQKLSENLGYTYTELTKQTEAMEEATKTAASFALANQDVLEHLRALGDLETQQAYMVEVGYQMVAAGATVDQAMAAIKQLAREQGISIPIDIDLSSIEGRIPLIRQLAARIANEAAMGWGGEWTGLTVQLQEDFDALAEASIRAFQMGEVGSAIQMLEAFEGAVRDSSAGVQVQDKLLENMRRSFLEATSATGKATTGAEDYGKLLEWLAGRTDEMSEATETASDSVEGLAEELGLAEDAAEEFSKRVDMIQAAFENFADPTSIFQELQQATDDGRVSLEQYAAEVRRQNESLINWGRNLDRIALLYGQDVADAMRELGPAGAQAVEEMAQGGASAEELAAAIAENIALTDEKMIAAHEAAIERLVDLTGEQKVRVLDILEDSGADFETFAKLIEDTMQTGGKSAVDALLAELEKGTTSVLGIVGRYGAYLAAGINPIIVSLGGKKVVVSENFARYKYGMADGGFLPAEAVIRQPQTSLVQWAEPETGGEAFIPLAASKRRRSLDIWKETGIRLGVSPEVLPFADGGFRKASDVNRPPKAPYNGISGTGDLAMRTMYQAAIDWIAKHGSRAAIVDFAKRFLGKPYLLGASGPNIFDCSGLVQYVYRNFGIHLPRVSRDQARVGRTVSPRDAEQADLLFYGRPTGHVAIYQGGGRTVEARGRRWGVTTASAFRPGFTHAKDVVSGRFDSGGVLPPGTTLATNYTGKNEVILPADWIDALTAQIGALVDAIRAQVNADKEIVAGTKGAAANELILELFGNRSSLAGSYISREASRLAMQQATGADIATQTATLVRQIEFIDKATAEARLQLDVAKSRGMDQEEINRLAESLFDLERDAADARDELEALARVPLEQAAARWNTAIGQTQMLMDLLANSSSAYGLQTELFPELMGQLGGGYQTALDLMNASTNPADIMGYADQALTGLSSMFAAEKAQLDRALDATLASIDGSQDDYERAWQARSDALDEELDRERDLLNEQYNTQRDALRKQLENLQKAQRDELNALNKFYEDKLRLLDDREREITRADEKRDRQKSIASKEARLRELLGQEGKTYADVQEIERLKSEIQEGRDELARAEAAWEREDQRLALQREREQAIERLELQHELQTTALRDQIEADEKRLEAQHKAAQKRLDARRDELERERQMQLDHFEAMRTRAQAAHQAEIDAAVEKYRALMQEVIDQQNALLGEQTDYYNAGYALGKSFADGVLASLPLIEAAGLAAADALSRYLELHSPADMGPLASLDTWFEKFIPTLLEPFNPPAAVQPIMDTAVPTTRIVHEHRITFDGDATGIDVHELAREVGQIIGHEVEVRRYGY